MSVVAASPAHTLCSLLADLIEKHSGRRPEVSFTWHDAASLLLEDHSYETVEKAIRHSQGGDGFWRAYVTSMPMLRQRFDSILGQLDSEPDWKVVKQNTLGHYERNMRRAYEMDGDGNRHFLPEEEIQLLLDYKRKKLGL